jgi:hypothetical protein
MDIMQYLPTLGKNIDQPLPQDDTMMQLEMQRRMKFADALRNQEMPQGQMVSGHYVAPSWTQALAGLANQYVGNKAEENAMKQYGDYQKTKQKRLADALEGLNADTAPKAITEQSAYQIQVPNGQTPQTENLGGMQPIQNGMKTIDVPMTNTTGYQPRTAAERDAAIYKFAVATQNPDLMSKVAFDRIAKQDQADVLKAQHEYDYLVHKRDRGEKLDDTEKANLFALQKMGLEQQFTGSQNALTRGVTMRGQNMTHADQAPVAVLDANGNPTYVPRNQAIGQTPYNAAQEAKDVVKVQQKAQNEISAQQVLDQAQTLFSHPGRKGGTGMSSWMGSIPGTDAKDFSANLATFKAQTFIPMVSALKGMGALSDAEGRKLTESVGALDPSVKEADFVKNLQAATRTLYQKAKAAGLNVSEPEFLKQPAATQQSDIRSQADAIIGH